MCTGCASSIRASEQHQRQTTCLDTGKGDTEQLPRNSTPSTNSIFPPPLGVTFFLQSSKKPRALLRMKTRDSGLHGPPSSSRGQQLGNHLRFRSGPAQARRTAEPLRPKAAPPRHHSQEQLSPIPCPLSRSSQEAVGQSTKQGLGTRISSVSFP